MNIEINNLKEKFKNCNIAVIGDVMIDEYFYGKVDRISPEAPVPIVQIKRENWLPGGAANVVNNLISLGAKSSLFSVVGDDEYGKKIRKHFLDEKVNVEGLIIDKTRNTTVKTRIIGCNQQMLRIDKEDIEYINYNNQCQIINKIKSQLDLFDGIIISDYAKGIITPDLFKDIVDSFRKANKFVLVDPRQRNFYFYLNQTAITPNVKEAQEALGRIFENEEDLLDGGQELLKRTNSDIILMTRSEKGMTLFVKGKKPMSIPTQAINVFDVTGAGDTVISVFSLGLAAKLNIEEAVFIANIAAGFVVGQVGTAVANCDEIINYYKKL